MNFIKTFLNDESGATAIEYALIAGLISIVVVAVLTGIGNQLTGVFNDIRADVTAANAAN